MAKPKYDNEGCQIFKAVASKLYTDFRKIKAVKGKVGVLHPKENERHWL